jgi:hypothetical protein
LARLKAANVRCALFFCAYVGISQAKTTIPLENFRAAKLVVLLSDCKWESGSESG